MLSPQDEQQNYLNSPTHNARPLPFKDGGDDLQEVGILPRPQATSRRGEIDVGDDEVLEPISDEEDILVESVPRSELESGIEFDELLQHANIGSSAAEVVNQIE